MTRIAVDLQMVCSLCVVATVGQPGVLAQRQATGPIALRQSMEKVVRAAVAGVGSSFSQIRHNSPFAKEISYVLRNLGPAACRDSDLFRAVCSEIVVISNPGTPIHAL